MAQDFDYKGDCPNALPNVVAISVLWKLYTLVGFPPCEDSTEVLPSGSTLSQAASLGKLSSTFAVSTEVIL